MQRNQAIHICLTTLAFLSLTAGTACTKSDTNASAADDSKIPITTKSDEARKEYITGRDLSERLLGQESLAHFEKAVTLDPDFASGELALANNAPTTKDFFDHLNKAVALAGNASDGEKLLILATQAGANGNAEQQKDDLQKAAAAYPNDERAQFALANYYFGQQDFSSAIEYYNKAIEINPNYSQAYNLLGYSYRQQNDFANSEQSFKKYIELIPNDPNPYDSYAEMLLKMGRYDESVTQYRKALSVDPHFIPSYFGMSADFMYMGKSKDAQQELESMASQARNDGELRTAYFGMAVLASDGGKFDDALSAMDKEYAVAQKKNDFASMSADLQAKGNILSAAQKYDAAAQQFDRSFQLIQDSNSSPEIKENARLLHEFNMAAIAVAKKDYKTARTHADEFHKGAEASKNPFQMKQAHELAGRIALAEKDYGTAITELGQANQQDPRNLLRLSQAYRAKGEKEEANKYLMRAADFNSLPALPYAFIRVNAQKMLAAEKG